jgi:OmcA/MtrC family decaheme c-type cytochrome
MTLKSYSRLLLPLALIIGVAVLTSAPTPPYPVDSKAAFADEALVNFVRPGLIIKIASAEVDSVGTVKARVQFTDPKGLPLDREGITTPGTISCSLLIARIPVGATQYLSYTSRMVPSTITGKTMEQATADSGGVWTKLAEGDYTYTFATKLGTGYDRTVTHTIGAYGSRNLTEFDLGTNFDDAVFNFVPNGSAVTTTRDMIKTATCNRCHLDMGFHGGSRKTMELCILCHTPQTTDPDTLNTVDMPVMVHKIHAGASLPSVQAGGKYVIIGFGGSVNDYSDITFPADTRNCTHCHQQDTGAAQAKAYTKPTMAACGACHDNIDWATGKNHQNQKDDKSCILCHPADSGKEFDVSVVGAHVIPTDSKSLAGVVFELLKVENTAPGSNPTVTFTVKDKSGSVINAATMSRLRLHLAGPNTDYTYYVTEDATKATLSGGIYTYKFTATVPKDAKGSWTIAVEGRVAATVNGASVNDVGLNKQMAFSVDGSKVTPRRVVVDLAKCNQCHYKLNFHGGSRNTTQQCVICHAPTRTAAPEPQRSIDLGVMIHKIHRGADLARGYGISSADFSDIGFPGDLRSCTTCHSSSSTYQLPLADSSIPVVSPFDYISPAPRATADCLACHDTKYAAAHANSNIDPTLGEACAACHGPNSEKSVDKVHAR